jgi:hypothetical protein
MVVAMAALFVALGGAAYAANLAKNSVGAKQIKTNGVRSAEVQDDAVGAAEIGNNAVGGSEVADGAMTGADIQDESLGSLDVDGLGSSDVTDESLKSEDVEDNSLKSQDVEANSLTGGDVQDEGLGSDDVGGLTGRDVSPGTFLGGDVTVQFEQASADLGNGAELSLDVHCPAGRTAIGGGVRGDVTNSELTKVTASRPVIDQANTGAPGDNGTFTGWRGTFVNENNGAGIRPEVWVICAG